MTADRTIVFDVGGTWFRSAVWSGGELQGRHREPAVNFHRHPECDVAWLQERLLDWLVAEARRLQRQHDTAPRALISMGAALNAHTGYVFGSGPLWGPAGQPLDLLGGLRQRAPEIAWTVLNDVTAALLRHVAAGGERSGRTALVTISSGIACRVFDHARRAVPVDPQHGLQGEIGHLPVCCTFAGDVLELACDCGGNNHLNAFASGRGLQGVLARAAAKSGRSAGSVPELLAAAREGCAWSRSVVAAALEPLAGLLAVMLTHDPELDPVLFTGGVAAGLGEHLVEILRGQLESSGLYQISARDPGWFGRRLRLGFLDDDSGLLGCGLADAVIDRAGATA